MNSIIKLGPEDICHFNKENISSSLYRPQYNNPSWVANNFENPGAMWANNLTSFTSPHWYFGAHIFNKMLKAITKEEKFNKVLLVFCPPFSYRVWYPLNNFHMVFTLATSYYVDLMNILTLKNVLSIANTEKESAFKSWVKPQLGSGKVKQNP